MKKINKLLCLLLMLPLLSICLTGCQNQEQAKSLPATETITLTKLNLEDYVVINVNIQDIERVEESGNNGYLLYSFNVSISPKIENAIIFTNASITFKTGSTSRTIKLDYKGNGSNFYTSYKYLSTGSIISLLDDVNSLKINYTEVTGTVTIEV